MEILNQVQDDEWGESGEQDHSAGTLRYSFRALDPNGNMTLETLLNVLRAMGVKLSVGG